MRDAKIKVNVWIIKEHRWMKSAILCPDGSAFEYTRTDDFIQLDFFESENERRYYPEEINVNVSLEFKDLHNGFDTIDVETFEKIKKKSIDWGGDARTPPH